MCPEIKTSCSRRRTRFREFQLIMQRTKCLTMTHLSQWLCSLCLRLSPFLFQCVCFPNVIEIILSSADGCLKQLPCKVNVTENGVWYYLCWTVAVFVGCHGHKTAGRTRSIIQREISLNRPTVSDQKQWQCSRTTHTHAQSMYERKILKQELREGKGQKTHKTIMRFFSVWLQTFPVHTD